MEVDEAKKILQEERRKKFKQYYHDHKDNWKRYRENKKMKKHIDKMIKERLKND